MRTRLLAAALGLALLVGGAVALRRATSERGPLVRADFVTARGLVAGADVRIAGGVAGRVESLRVTPAGRAEVTMRLDAGRPAPRADATAAIRPVDLLGDVYLDLSPGRAAAALHGPIAVARTSNQPRLDELLSSFTPPVRAGLQALLVESGDALAGRGEDLGRAAVELRPALSATDGVLRELASQNAALGAVVADAGRAARQLAAAPADVRGLLRGLRSVTVAADARRGALASGIGGLPALLREVDATAGRLARTADAATPLAAQLDEAAPGVASATARLPAFLDALRVAAPPLRGTVAQLAGLLRGGAPTLRGLASGLDALGAVSTPVDGLVRIAEQAAPNISEGFFVDFADEAAEPGRQPFDPFADPRRNYWRGAAVMSCEAFGVPVAPGCLAKVLGEARALVSRPWRLPQPPAVHVHTSPIVKQVVGAVTGQPAAGGGQPPVPAPQLPAQAKQLLGWLLGG